MGKEAGIQSVNRALNVLSLFTHNSPQLGITEISDFLNLSKSTVHGFVRTLTKQGFLQQDTQTRRYGLGLKIYELGIVLAGSLEINVRGAGLAYQLATRVKLTSRIAIWDRGSALLTLNIDPHSHLFFVYQIGPRIPAYCSSVGKALLAYLEPEEQKRYFESVEFEQYTTNTIMDKARLIEEVKKTRERGYSIECEENVEGLACIGAAIIGRGEHLEGAISLSGSPEIILGGRQETLVMELLKTSKEISRGLGYFPESLGVTNGRKSKRK